MRARAHPWGLGMKSDNWVERFVAARLAEHDERVRFSRVGKAKSEEIMGGARSGLGFVIFGANPVAHGQDQGTHAGARA